jgi:peptidoglycan/LPS O-acetylase OafA/YrhL
MAHAASRLRAPEGHLLALDGVRGLAILYVMLLHFTLFRPDDGFGRTVRGFALAGWIGVDLFFVLSGFLITGILYRSKGGASYFRNFYMRRALRIFPLYFAYLALLLGVAGHLPGGAFLLKTDAEWSTWTYLTNVVVAIRGSWESVPPLTGHFWSLAVEEQYYLLWPVVVFFFCRRDLVRVALIGIAASLTLRVGMVAIGASPLAVFVLLFTRMDALFLGALIALAAQGEQWGRAVRMAQPAFLLGIGGIAAVISVQGHFDQFAPWTQTLGYSAVGILSAAIVLHALSAPEDGWVGRALRAGWLRAFGKYSYALYVLHILVLEGLLRADVAERLPSPLLGQTVVYAVGIGASFVLAYASWHLFEKHFLGLKSRFDTTPFVLSRPTPAPGFPPYQWRPGTVGTPAGVPSLPDESMPGL